jgi:hypothetical protein
MKHLQLFEEYHNYQASELNEDLLSDILIKAKKGTATGALVAALLSSPDIAAQDKTAIQKANTEKVETQETNGVGVGTSPDMSLSKDISLSRAIADLARDIPEGGELTYEIVDQKTIMEGGKYKTTTILKISTSGTKLTSFQVSLKKKAVLRDDAKIKREANRKLMEDRFINGAIIAGFAEEITDSEYEEGCKEEASNTEEVKDIVYREITYDNKKIKVRVNLKKYRKQREKMGRQDDAQLDGLEGPNFSHTKCGISKAGAKDAKREWSKK